MTPEEVLDRLRIEVSESGHIWREHDLEGESVEGEDLSGFVLRELLG